MLPVSLRSAFTFHSVNNHHILSTTELMYDLWAAEVNRLFITNCIDKGLCFVVLSEGTLHPRNSIGCPDSCWHIQKLILEECRVQLRYLKNN